MKKILLSSAAFLVAAGFASATPLVEPQEVLTCRGDARGKSFFQGGALMEASNMKPGWHDDGLSSVTVKLLANSKDVTDIDIVINNHANTSYSYRDDGFKMLLAGHGILSVIATSDAAQETFIFDYQKHRVLWTAAKYNEMVVRISAFELECE